MDEYINRKILTDLVLSKLKFIGDARIMNQNHQRRSKNMLGFLIGVIFGGTVALIAMSLTMYPDCEEDEDDEE